MPPARSQTGLDRAHGRMVLLVFIAAALLAFGGLELVRWQHLAQLTAAGFSPWGDDGYYTRNIPGRSLTLTRTHSQTLIAVAAVTAGATAAMLVSIAAALDMHLPFKTVTRYSLLAFLFLPAAVVANAVSLRAPERLTIDIRHDTISIAPGHVALKLSSITAFDHYWVQAGRRSHEELGAVTNTGDQVDLLPVFSTLHHKSYWEGLCLTNALQDYVSSGGREFPAS